MTLEYLAAELGERCPDYGPMCDGCKRRHALDVLLAMPGEGIWLDKHPLQLLIRAWLELNSIRARDGAPPGVCHESFSQLVDDIDACVTERTGHTAHCHPWLYKREGT